MNRNYFFLINLQITGQACPLSFKGSPHWMAPEVSMLTLTVSFLSDALRQCSLSNLLMLFQVMNNANGCNLAVDIWSLGCTVVEMATTKPPWSQYEGVSNVWYFCEFVGVLTCTHISIILASMLV